MKWRDAVAEINPELTEAILEKSVTRSYGPDVVMFREGDPCDGMYLLEEGRVLIQATTIAGSAVGLNVADAGEAVGEMALLRPDVARNATVSTLRPTSVLLIRPKVFALLREEFPEVDRFIVAILDSRLREMSERLAEAVHSTAEERVHRRLMALASAFDGTVRMSQEKLATLAGTTRPTVNRVLQDLARDGFVRLGRARVEVLRTIDLRTAASAESDAPAGVPAADSANGLAGQ